MNSLQKMVGAGLLMASVYALVWMGKLEPQEYLQLCEACLATLGIIHVAGRVASSPQTPAQPTSQKENSDA